MNRPQCAKDFESRFISSWPVMIQPKKDGIRCMAEWNEDNETLDGYKKPREKKPLVFHKPHVQELLNSLGVGPCDMELLTGALDGELFKPNMWFEDIVSGVQGGHPDYWPGMEWHLFDTMDPAKPFSERWPQLMWWYNRMCRMNPGFDAVVKLVQCKTVNDMDTLQRWMTFWSQEEEGIIIRDPNEFYIFDKRTRGCMRWKYTKDSEFPVKNIIDGKGKNVGIATFVCWNPAVGPKAEFNAAPMGTREQRMKYFQDREKIIGKQVTVQYQNMGKYGIPRFPKVKAVRDYE